MQTQDIANGTKQMRSAQRVLGVTLLAVVLSACAAKRRSTMVSIARLTKHLGLVNAAPKLAVLKANGLYVKGQRIGPLPTLKRQTECAKLKRKESSVWWLFRGPRNVALQLTPAGARVLMFQPGKDCFSVSSFPSKRMVGGAVDEPFPACQHRVRHFPPAN